MENGYLLLKSVERVRRGLSSKAIMPLYDSPQMTSAEANTMLWSDFKKSMKPFHLISSCDGITEFICTPKNVPWTVCDFNIYAGLQNETDPKLMLSEFSDFTPKALEDFFRIHFGLSKGLLKNGYNTIQFAIGFNPQDYSPGHHSVKRFHSHIRAIGSPFDERNIEEKPWRESTWFDRLSTIEPFAPLYQDVIDYLIRTNTLFGFDSNFFSTIKKSGYLLFSSPQPGDLQTFTRDFSFLYTAMKNHYALVERIFTDLAIDVQTGRYIPLPREQRVKNLNTHLELFSAIYSPVSLALLKYLSENIQVAGLKKSDNQRQIASSNQIYITRGFAGGFSFTSREESDNVEIAIFPRAITTTGPTKYLYADDRSAGFQKVDSTAGIEEILANSEFLKVASSVLIEYSRSKLLSEISV